MHPARFTGIGLVLRPQPDPDVTQARCSIRDCPATPASRLTLTMTPLILCLHFIPSAPRCFRCAQGYRCCEPWAHSSLCRHSALPCLRFTARRPRQSKKSSLEAGSMQDFFAKNRGRPKCNAETDTACRFVITHWRFYRPFARLALHIPLNQKAVFVLRSVGRSGGPLGQSGAAAP